MTTVLISAGDVSGDHHAAGLVRVLRARHSDWRVLGLAGREMRAAGVERVADQADLAVGGLLEIAGSLGRLLHAWRAMDDAIERAQPDLVVLVDSGGFNIPLARRVRRRSRARVLYYVAPQIWAWRRGRIRKLARRVDRMALIFPFEADVYAGTGLRVDFVGHPLVDELAELARRLDGPAARKQLGLPAAGRVVTLLPGSRRNEIDCQLPVQLETARQLHAMEPEVQFVLAVADSIEAEQVRRHLAAAALPAALRLHVHSGRAREAMLAADVSLAKPGTVTTELMLLDRPMVVMGRAHPLTAALLRRFLRVPWLAMPNLIAGQAIVPERMQQEARPDVLAKALYDLFAGPVRDAQLAALAQARGRLGPGGAAESVARIAEEMLGRD
jgi:lipid-A-disaccharide synthase